MRLVLLSFCKLLYQKCHISLLVHSTALVISVDKLCSQGKETYFACEVVWPKSARSQNSNLSLKKNFKNPRSVENVSEIKTVSVEIICIQVQLKSIISNSERHSSGKSTKTS